MDLGEGIALGLDKESGREAWNRIQAVLLFVANRDGCQGSRGLSSGLQRIPARVSLD